MLQVVLARGAEVAVSTVLDNILYHVWSVVCKLTGLQGLALPRMPQHLMVLLYALQHQAPGTTIWV
jgi:hypothetical protein